MVWKHLPMLSQHTDPSRKYMLSGTGSWNKQSSKAVLLMLWWIGSGQRKKMSELSLSS